jgi:hypothetical protein
LPRTLAGYDRDPGEIGVARAGHDPRDLIIIITYLPEVNHE